MKVSNRLLAVTILIATCLVFGGDEELKKNNPKQVNTSSATAVEGKNQDEGSDLDYIQAKNLIYDQRYTEALPYLEKTLKRDPKNPHLNNEISKVYSLVGEVDKAIQSAKMAVDAEPTNIDYHSNLAEALTSAKNYTEAKRAYIKILELDPSNQRASLLIAMLDSEMGDDFQAIERLSKLVKENPDNPLALFYRARIYIEKNQMEEAKADLEKCLQQRPSFVEAGTALGLIYEKNNNTDDAIRVYSKIQGQGQFKKRLAFLYIQKNQLALAMESLSEYEQSEPDDYTARVKLGLLHFEMKEYDKARQKFEKILKEQPGAENVNFYLGWVYQAEKKWDLALAQFRKVTKKLHFLQLATRLSSLSNPFNLLGIT